MAEENEINPSTDLVNNKIEKICDWSVSRMIRFLKSAFRPDDFAMVEAELLAREKNSKLEIENLKEEKRTFSCKFDEERLEKMGIGDELRKCKKEVEEMRSEVSKLKAENFVLRGKEKSAEERCKRLSEEVKSMREKEHEIIDLKGKNCELECAKAMAESEMEILRVRFQVLDKRVSNLESGLTILEDEDDAKNQNGIGGEIGNSENGSFKPAEPETMNVKETPIVLPTCVSPRKASGHWPNAGKGGLPSQNVVEIVDLDSDDDSAPEENPSEKRMTSPTKNSHSAQICVGNGTPALKRKQTSSIDACENENGDNDDTTLSGKLKMRKFQESVCRPDDCHLNQWSTTNILSDINGVNRSTPREDFKVLRQHEQQTDAEQNSRDLMSVGFPLDGLCFSEDSSVSTDSESDDDSDGVHISFNHS